MLLMGLCAGTAALGLLIGAVWAFFSQQRNMAGRVTAVGTVVELTTQITASAASAGGPTPPTARARLFRRRGCRAASAAPPPV